MVDGPPYSSREWMYFNISLNIVSAKFVTEPSRPMSIIDHLLYYTDWRYFAEDWQNPERKNIQPAFSWWSKTTSRGWMTDGESRKSWNCPFLATLAISIISILFCAFMRNPAWVINELNGCCVVIDRWLSFLGSFTARFTFKTGSLFACWHFQSHRWYRVVLST